MNSHKTIEAAAIAVDTMFQQALQDSGRKLFWVNTCYYGL